MDEEDYIDNEEGGIEDDDIDIEEPAEDDSDDSDNEDDSVDDVKYKLREVNKHEIVPYFKTYENYTSQRKITKPFITKFEKAKILGIRAEMIAAGSPSVLNIPKGITSAYEIAKLEYAEKKIPLMIRRYLPNDVIEDWRLVDMVL